MTHETNPQFTNVQFSHATLNPFHLLEAALPYVKQYDETNTLTDQIQGCLDIEGDALELWHEQVTPFLESLGAEDTYFGCTEGDGSDIGWWIIPSED